MRKIIYTFLFLVVPFAIWSCDDKPKVERPIQDPSRAAQTMEALWGTSAKQVDAIRKAHFATIQGYADKSSGEMFKQYLAKSDELANTLEKYDDIYAAYRAGFDRVLLQIQNAKPASGTAQIWYIYNMGYIVKTPSGCFGVDIYHRYAARLAPYLDFLCVTHSHQDHSTSALIDAMLSLGKPVLSNYLQPSKDYPYTSKVKADYTIGKFKLHTFITSHNNDAVKNINVTVFQIECGDDAGKLALLHTGDSNFRPEQYDVTVNIDVMIPRYAPNALTENNIIGKSVKPSYVLLSHILELSHSDPDSSRWMLEQGLTRASLIDCSNTWMPFWGESYVWQGSELKTVN